MGKPLIQFLEETVTREMVQLHRAKDYIKSPSYQKLQKAMELIQNLDAEQLDLRITLDRLDISNRKQERYDKKSLQDAVTEIETKYSALKPSTSSVEIILGELKLKIPETYWEQHTKEYIEKNAYKKPETIKPVEKKVYVPEKKLNSNLPAGITEEELYQELNPDLLISIVEKEVYSTQTQLKDASFSRKPKELNKNSFKTEASTKKINRELKGNGYIIIINEYYTDKLENIYSLPIDMAISRAEAEYQEIKKDTKYNTIEVSKKFGNEVRKVDRSEWLKFTKNYKFK